MQYPSFPVSYYGPEAAVQQKNYRKMAHVVAPRNSKKRKHKLNVNFPSLNLHQKAESVKVFDKGLTTNTFDILLF